MKNKKWILGLGTITTITTSILVVVACGKQEKLNIPKIVTKNKKSIFQEVETTNLVKSSFSFEGTTGSGRIISTNIPEEVQVFYLKVINSRNVPTNDASYSTTAPINLSSGDIVYIKFAIKDSYKNTHKLSIKIGFINSITKIVPNLTITKNANAKVLTIYNKPGNLKYNDSFWSLDDLSYSEKVLLGKGKSFYNTNIKKKNGKFPTLKLEDWIDVYDNPRNKMLYDPYHIYKKNAPTSYRSIANYYGKIYRKNNDDGNAPSKTGNNNNGLNGLYSGARFKYPSKEFNEATVETLNSQIFNPSQNVSNGWEHVSPQSKSRQTLGTTGSKLSRAIGDLHNLRPSIQNIFNGPRSNYNFGMVLHDNNKDGVDFEIGTQNGMKLVEPRVNVRGDIARILFYMHDRYHIKYDFDYYKQLLLWAALDPVTPEEKTLDLKIKEVMGFSNEYVSKEKQLPYHDQIEAKVLAANKDTTPNSHTWGPTPKTLTPSVTQVVANSISNKQQAAALDWTSNVGELTLGMKPSKTSELWKAHKEDKKEIIVRIIMKKDNAIHYYILNKLQSRAILVRDFGAPLKTKKLLKIAINPDSKKWSQKLMTKLSSRNQNNTYGDMPDEIIEVKWKALG